MVFNLLQLNTESKNINILINLDKLNCTALKTQITKKSQSSQINLRYNPKQHAVEVHDLTQSRDLARKQTITITHKKKYRVGDFTCHPE